MLGPGGRAFSARTAFPLPLHCASVSKFTRRSHTAVHGDCQVSKMKTEDFAGGSGLEIPIAFRMKCSLTAPRCCAPSPMLILSLGSR